VLVEFIAVSLLILRGKLTRPVSKGERSFRALALDSFHVLQAELVLGLGLVGLCPHSDHYIAISAVFVEKFSFLCFLLLEMLAVAGLEVVVGIVLQLHVDRLLSLDLNGSQWLLVKVRLVL
jgi:hypothetical protein